MKRKVTRKLSEFIFEGQSQPVKFIETMHVKEGVSCDVYSFIDDLTKDLAIVTVEKGFKTPLQKVLEGNRTTEGLMSGRGILTVTTKDGVGTSYDIDASSEVQSVDVLVGQTMQWVADEEVGLVFFEVCDPPYQDGRFEDLPEPAE